MLCIIFSLLAAGANILGYIGGQRPPHHPPPGCDNPVPGIKNPNCPPVPIDNPYAMAGTLILGIGTAIWVGKRKGIF